MLKTLLSLFLTVIEIKINELLHKSFVIPNQIGL